MQNKTFPGSCLLWINTVHYSVIYLCHCTYASLTLTHSQWKSLTLHIL